MKASIMGYRYFDTFNVPVSVPFGHGLSYTTFEYSDAKLSSSTFSGGNSKITASVKITNTGEVAGKEVVQFYIGEPGVEIPKPVKELKAYVKTELLEPGQSQVVTAEFDAMSLASYYDSTTAFNGQWRVEKGHHIVYFASSSQDIRLTKSFVVNDSFTAKFVSAEACDPSATLKSTLFGSNALNPVQIKATFKPLAGALEGESFQKAYTVMGAKYGYLPALPDGYDWYEYPTANVVTENSPVPPANVTLVAGKPTESIKIEASATYSVKRGATISFNALLSDGDAIDFGVVWEVSNPLYATVDGNSVTILNKTGTVILTATDSLTGYSNSIVLRIT
jgi:hypothetical protein